ncbi:Neurotransmitter-gated ion-channel transmembrane region [Cichlidogyrus casuarinus]|uniref:Neurotransmitter-gated ion-channel transmembrane region n=1 Tax=Cichlidogyrus casuarinus TaxID=1844966 RepID=A0ABD2Q1Q8_9PLAT
MSSKLLNDLFKSRGYNPRVLPLKNLNDTINIKLKVDLIQILSVEEKSQVLRTNVWIQHNWQDYQLTWDPQSYNGLANFRVAPEKIWKPDVVLLNNADGNYDWLWQPKAILSSDGTLLWYPPAIYNSACTIDVEFFPFDQQECKIKFGSLTFSANQVIYYSHFSFKITKTSLQYLLFQSTADQYNIFESLGEFMTVN